MNDKKFCVDCEHFYDYGGLCLSPLNEIDLLSGKPFTIRADRARYSDSKHVCGPDAKFFEKKVEKKPVQFTEDVKRKKWWFF